MHRRAPLIVACLAAACGGILDLSAVAAQAEKAAPFTLGVLRRDGFVIPFAAHDGRRWDAPWPAGLDTVELPISLDAIERRWWGRDVTPPKTLTLWAEGKPRAELTLLAPAFVPLTCATRRIGLRTNYHAAEVPPRPREQPYPKDGLVVSGTQRIDAISRVPAGSPDLKGVAIAILEEFNSAETEAANAYLEWRHPFSKAQRAKLPIEIEALYQADMDEPDWVAFYVEAVRRYPPGPQDDGCGPLTVARGWVRSGPKGRYRVDIGAQVTYCDRAGVTFMLPLGLVKAGGHTDWVYQLAGYESEAYLIARPTAGRIERLVAYPAVSCPWRGMSP